MRATLKLLLVGVALAAAACGVPEQKYKAALDETSKAVKEGESQKQRADACEAKLADTSKRAADLTAQLSELEKAASAASADAAQQRQLAAQLAKAREAVEAEKAKLQQEKVAASLDAEQARKQSAVLEQEALRQRQLAAQLAQEKTALEKKSAEYEALATSLDSEIKAGRIQVSELKGKLTVRMAEKVLFPSGSATVSRAGKETLEKIAVAFKDVGNRLIRVEGHTDNVPIKTERFPSNWELSSARAIAVVRILQDKGVDPTLLGAAGYASYQPVAPNDTPEGRAQNRRIEISLAAPLSALPTAAAR